MKKRCIPCIAVVLVIFASSCGKEKSVRPNLSFNSGSGYTYTDDTLVNGTIFKIGINASKTGSESLLTSCSISRSVNGGEDSIIQQMNFFYQSFTQTYYYVAGDSGNIERYTFTVGENDGNTESISVTITDI